MKYTFDDINLDYTIEVEYEITEIVYNNFLNTFLDINPIHIDDDYAIKKGFKGKVMHGAILNGFISNLIGVHLPGEDSLIHFVNIDFHSPMFLNDKIRITAKVIQKVESIPAIVINMRIQNLQSNKLIAKAKVQVGFVSA